MLPHKHIHVFRHKDTNGCYREKRGGREIPVKGGVMVFFPLFPPTQHNVSNAKTKQQEKEKNDSKMEGNHHLDPLLKMVADDSGSEGEPPACVGDGWGLATSSWRPPGLLVVESGPAATGASCNEQIARKWRGCVAIPASGSLRTEGRMAQASKARARLMAGLTESSISML